MNNSLKSYLPYLTLLACGLLFSIGFQQRFDFPVHDESLYSAGRFATLAGWSQLYQLVYFILNSLTSSPMQSFDILLYSFTFILFPSAIYKLGRKLKISASASALLGFICLISPWNFPVDPRVQIFNMTWLLWALIIRWDDKNPLSRFIVFYFMMIASLYSRPDNLIVIIFILAYDLYTFIRERKWRALYSIATSIAIAIGSCYLLFRHSPFVSSRTWFAFLDYLRWRNHEELSDVLSGEGVIYDKLNIFFKGAKSIPEALWAQPEIVAGHFLKNAKEFVPGFLSNFDLLLSIPAWILFPVLLLMLLILEGSNERVEKPPRDVFVLGFALLAKSLTIGILLQPMGKYIFESNIALLFGLFLFAREIKTIIKLSHLQFSYFLLPFLLLFHPFNKKQLENKFDLRETLNFLKVEELKYPIKKIISVDGIHNWLSTPIPVDLWNNRSYDQLIKSDFNSFLLQTSVDTIVIESHLRGLLHEVKLFPFFKAFELNHQAYGFQLVKGTPLEGLTIYRRISDN